MKKVFRLDGLCCANCAAKIERNIAKLDGVISARLNFMTTKLTIDGDDDKIDEIINKSMAIIKKVEPNVVVKKG